MVFICASIAIATPSAFAAPLATSFSEKGDPARWYRPLDTARAKYDNAMTEARNARAEALRGCRGERTRKACAAEARDRYQKDAARARGFLAPTRQLG